MVQRGAVWAVLSTRLGAGSDPKIANAARPAKTAKSDHLMKKPPCKSCARRRVKIRRALRKFNKWKSK